MDGSFMWDEQAQTGATRGQASQSTSGPLTVAVIGTGGDGGLTVELLRHGFSVVPSTHVPSDPAWMIERRVDALVALPGSDAAALKNLFNRLQSIGNPARLIGIDNAPTFDQDWFVSTSQSNDRRELILTIAHEAAASRRARRDASSTIDRIRGTRKKQAPVSIDDTDRHLEAACFLADRLREELDVEMLLRATLEYTIAQLGPVNAAIYLPRPSGDLALGAFVGSSLPSGESETIFDDLASSIADRNGQRETTAIYRTDQELDDVFEGGAYWLERSDVIVTPCKDQDRELAVLIVFHERHEGGLAESAVDTLESIAAALTGQLARAVRVHNRMCSGDSWFGFDVEDPHGGLF